MTKANIDKARNLFVTQFELTSRTSSILQRANIEKLGQLADMERTEIFKHRNVGSKTVEELDRLLTQNGLCWMESVGKIPVPIDKKKLIEADIIKAHKKLQDENKRLTAEVELLRSESFKSNLEKLRSQGRIKDLEEKLEELTMSTIKR